MSNPLVFKLKCELYPHKIVFYIGDMPEPKIVGKLCKRYKLWNGEGKVPCVGDGRASTTTFDTGCFVWLPVYQNADAAEWLGTFNHELVHILCNASHHMGIFMNYDSDEFHAYYAGWITRQVIKRLKTDGQKDEQ